MKTTQFSLEIRLLGAFQATVDGRVVDDNLWRRPKARQLIKLLSLAPRHQLHSEQVMEALWPDSTVRSAANSLNKMLHMARRALEPELESGGSSRFLIRRAESVALQAEPLWIDVDAFQEAALRTTRTKRVEDYRAALDLYSGDLLEEDLYEDWARSKRDQLRILYLDALSRLGELHEELGDPASSIGAFNQLLGSDPANEDAHRRIMRLYASTGRRQQALQQFENCRAALSRELDAEPEEATSELHRDILSGKLKTPAPARQAPPPTGTVVDSLAVLPFVNSSDDSELDYLSEGITESLINSLSQIPSLRIMARSTVFRYQGKDLDPQIIGRELSVRAVVLGRLAFRSQRLVIAAELVNVQDGSLLWGDRYNRTSKDIFAVQEDISGEISEKLRMKLSGDEKRRLRKRHTENTQAYQSYLKGRFHWNKRTGNGLRLAIEYFQKAIEEDPTYALAYSGLADCHNLVSLYSAVPPRDAMPKAKAAALRALEIDGSLAEAQTSLAYVQLYYDWDWPAADRGFRRAMELNPNYATAHHWYHEYLTAMGRFEEEQAQIVRAKELDPLSLIINAESGWGLYYAREFERAARHLDRTLKMDAHFPVAHFILGLVYQQQGNFEGAIAELQRAIELISGSPFALAIGVLGHAYARSGSLEQARAQLERLRELARKDYVPAYAFALVHIGLGDKDPAFASLRDAFEERYDRLIYLKVDPLFDDLRSDPRFEDLIGKIGL